MTSVRRTSISAPIICAWAVACLGAGCTVERDSVPQARAPIPVYTPGWIENDSRGPLPPSGTTCPVRFEVSQFENCRSQHPEVFQGYRIQSPESPTSCTDVTGYPALYLYPRVEATTDFQVSGSTVYLGFRELPTSDVKQQLIQSLALSPGDTDPGSAIQVMPFAPDFALFPTGEQAEVTIEQHDFGPPGSRTGPRGPALAFRFGSGTVPGAAALSALRSGSQPLRLYSSRAGMNEKRHILSWTLYPQAQSSLDSQDEASIFDVTPDLWRRASALSGDAQGAERSRVIAQAATWLRYAGADPSECSASFGDLIAFARQGWDPAPDAAHLTVDRGVDLVQRLAFLSVAAPGDPVAGKYLEPMSELGPYYGDRSEEAAEWVREILFLAGNPYTLDQRDWVFEAARRIQNGTGNTDGAHAWQMAKTLLARGSGLGASQAPLVVRAADWLSNADGASEGPGLSSAAALDKAMSYVTTRGLDDAGFELLRDSYLWSASYPGPKLAPSDALARAESYAFDRHMSRGDLQLLKDTFLWIVVDDPGPQVPRASGLSYAENYLYSQHMNRAGLQFTQGVYLWLSTQPGPALGHYASLGKAQDYVFTRHMAQAQWSALKSAYSRLRPAQSPADALAHAEAQAFPAR